MLIVKPTKSNLSKTKKCDYFIEWEAVGLISDMKIFTIWRLLCNLFPCFYTEKRWQNILHYQVFSQNNDLSYYCNFWWSMNDIMVTFFTITTKKSNTAVNSIAERQRYPASMVDKQSDFPELNVALRHILNFTETACSRRGVNAPAAWWRNSEPCLNRTPNRNTTGWVCLQDIWTLWQYIINRTRQFTLRDLSYRLVMGSRSVACVK